MQDKLNTIIELMDFNSISSARKSVLLDLAQVVKKQISAEGETSIIFICTHNSRRSQMSQVWANVFAEAEGLNIHSFSGGTETTAVAPTVLSTFEHFGFKVKHGTGTNAIHKLSFNDKAKDIELHSKVYDDSYNPKTNFIAAMTCSDADENCPIVIGCEARIPLTYNDPKLYDGSALEDTMYQFEAFKIGTELKYAFSLIKSL